MIYLRIISEYLYERHTYLPNLLEIGKASFIHTLSNRYRYVINTDKYRINIGQILDDFRINIGQISDYYRTNFGVFSDKFRTNFGIFSDKFWIFLGLFLDNYPSNFGLFLLKRQGLRHVINFFTSRLTLWLFREIFAY